MRLDDLTVEVRDKNLTRVGLIRPEELILSVDSLANNVGTWQLTLPVEHSLALPLSSPGAGLIVTLGNDVLMSGPMTTPTRTATSADPAGTLTVQGVSDDITLADALAFPQPSNADPATQTVNNDARTGPAETLMHAYVTANIGPSAPAARRNARLVMGPNLARGASIHKVARFIVLGTLLEQLATPAGLGFRVVQRGSNLQFETYQVADRTKTIRLDVYNNSLSSQKVAVSAPSVTWALVAGQGEGTARQMYVRTNTEATAAQAAWGRRIERFIDQRQTDDVDALKQAGDEALADGGFTGVNVQVVAMDDATMVYGRDWFLGDRVTVVVGTGEVTSNVTGFRLRADRSGVRLGALLGKRSEFNEDAAQNARLGDLERRVSYLEAR